MAMANKYGSFASRAVGQAKEMVNKKKGMMKGMLKDMPTGTSIMKKATAGPGSSASATATSNVNASNSSTTNTGSSDSSSKPTASTKPMTIGKLPSVKMPTMPKLPDAAKAAGIKMPEMPKMPAMPDISKYTNFGSKVSEAATTAGSDTNRQARRDRIRKLLEERRSMFRDKMKTRRQRTNAPDEASTQ